MAALKVLLVSALPKAIEDFRNCYISWLPFLAFQFFVSLDFQHIATFTHSMLSLFTGVPFRRHRQLPVSRKRDGYFEK